MPGVGLCRIAAAKLSTTRGTLDTIIDSLQVGSLEQPEVRKKAFFWLAERVNTFVNVLRPRMRSAAADYQSQGNRATNPGSVAHPPETFGLASGNDRNRANSVDDGLAGQRLRRFRPSSSDDTTEGRVLATPIRNSRTLHERF
jgi:hypothetical protein